MKSNIKITNNAGKINIITPIKASMRRSAPRTILKTNNIKLNLFNCNVLINENNPISPIPQRNIELIVNVGESIKTGIANKNTTKKIQFINLFWYIFANLIIAKIIIKFEKINNNPKIEYLVPSKRYNLGIRIPKIFEMNEVPEFGLPVYLPLII